MQQEFKSVHEESPSKNIAKMINYLEIMENLVGEQCPYMQLGIKNPTAPIKVVSKHYENVTKKPASVGPTRKEYGHS